MTVHMSGSGRGSGWPLRKVMAVVFPSLRSKGCWVRLRRSASRSASSSSGVRSALPCPLGWAGGSFEEPAGRAPAGAWLSFAASRPGRPWGVLGVGGAKCSPLGIGPW